MPAVLPVTQPSRTEAGNDSTRATTTTSAADHLPPPHQPPQQRTCALSQSRRNLLHHLLLATIRLLPPSTRSCQPAVSRQRQAQHAAAAVIGARRGQQLPPRAGQGLVQEHAAVWADLAEHVRLEAAPAACRAAQHGSRRGSKAATRLGTAWRDTPGRGVQLPELVPPS